ncbi:GNAT family N-acetyltransferase [Paenibacillus apiarius]|uniref:GNAT family N-acetyltransferase n=1 Tax=Paenibacillus apiarius TaxID=46240 RepID=UPI0019800833|nr:GNAT family N-acetyltransferase [Paenibacillus apiarius]MBN3526997.1 GNAT family N-acetyltransferase [Paenibacillus apiarius]
MIKRISIVDEQTASQVLAVQLPAYRVEADLIRFEDIPPLKDNISSLQQCGETFHGYYVGERLAGAVSYKQEGETIDIHRMIVHPDYFRRGIAQALLQHVERMHPDAHMFIVATGARNEPAKRLYEKNGYELVREQEAAPGLILAFFQKNKTESADAEGMGKGF